MGALERLELKTDRLRLKALDSTFAECVLAYYVRNRAFLREWNPTTGDEFYTTAFHAARLAQEQALMRDGRLLRLHLFDRADTACDHVLGVIALNNIVRGAFQSCHLGYQIDRQAGGRGLMTEALRRVIRYAFDDMLLHRLEANIMPRNTRSLRVVERLGFANEGLAKRYLKINGAWEDHIHYVLLNPAVE